MPDFRGTKGSYGSYDAVIPEDAGSAENTGGGVIRNASPSLVTKDTEPVSLRGLREASLDPQVSILREEVETLKLERDLARADAAATVEAAGLVRDACERHADELRRERDELVARLHALDAPPTSRAVRRYRALRDWLAAAKSASARR